MDYTYDDAGRRETMAVAGQTAVSYTYDNANRLMGITQGTATVTLTYDNAGRRSTLTYPNGIVATYGYDNANQLTHLTYTSGDDDDRRLSVHVRRGWGRTECRRVVGADGDPGGVDQRDIQRWKSARDVGCHELQLRLEWQPYK